MKTITAKIDGDVLTAEDGSRWKRVDGIEIGTRYEFWLPNGWGEECWDGDVADYFYRANDLIAWTDADKPRIENRQKALIAADAWFDAHGRFVPDWDDENQIKYCIWLDGSISSFLRSYPIGVRYFFKTEAEAKKFAVDMGEHLKWL